MSKKVLTGNQAIARGFYEAGGRLASSYPGSPTVEILETVKKYKNKNIYSEFSINEKVALEVAIGGSFYGARSMVVMKHVGLNVCADPLMTFTQMPTHGGFVLVSGDDPGMASSQNEQDNRIFAKFANMAVFAPGDSQEAKDLTKEAFKISEEYKLPVMLNITSRVCHSRSIVELEDRQEVEPEGFIKSQSDYVMLPPANYQKQYDMQTRLRELEDYAYNSPYNFLEEKEGADTLIICSGLMYYNLKELDPNASIYKLGMVYPISTRKIEELAKDYKNIIVLEELMPFIENELRLKGFDVKGKEYFPFSLELHIEDIRDGLVKAGLFEAEARPETKPLVSRPPMFCAGCPHRPVFDVLKKLKVDIMGDIGCYSMASGMAFEATNTIVSMGATVGITKGMGKMRTIAGDNKPIVSVIGDGTFFHSGMTGFANLLHQVDPKDKTTFIILDNGTTAMTGGQGNLGSGDYDPSFDVSIDPEDLLHTMGFENVQKVDQFNYDELKKILKEEVNKEGISIIITTRPCALRYKIKNDPFYVDPEVCIGCRTCVKTNCPPIRMKKYDGIDKLKSSIDPDACVGCSVCAQVCPVNAIKKL